ASDGGSDFRLLYTGATPLVEKIEAIAVRIYGASGVDILPPAAKALKLYEELGFGHLPICMAKTQYSLSHDPALKGRPSGFRVPIRDVRLSAGAGFITPLLGEMRTMPGLPSRPGGENIDIDAAWFGSLSVRFSHVALRRGLAPWPARRPVSRRPPAGWA